MERIEEGMLAVSRAGHDRDCLYVISGVDGEYVYLVDGRIRTLSHPKKKKKKHIQIVRTIPIELSKMTDGELKNEDIRRILNVKSRCY